MQDSTTARMKTDVSKGLTRFIADPRAPDKIRAALGGPPQPAANGDFGMIIGFFYPALAWWSVRVVSKRP